MGTAADTRDAIKAIAADADAGNVTRAEYLQYAAGQLRELTGMPLDPAVESGVHNDLHTEATQAYRDGYLSYEEYNAVDVWLAHSRRGRRRPSRLPVRAEPRWPVSESSSGCFTAPTARG